MKNKTKFKIKRQEKKKGPYLGCVEDGKYQVPFFHLHPFHKIKLVAGWLLSVQKNSFVNNKKKQ